MIYTLTLNPAIDRTIFVQQINPTDVTRVQQTVRDAAGKGINVARVIDSLHEPVTCLGFLGGNNGDFIRHELDAQSIAHHFVHIAGETRENIKVCEEKNGTTLELNEAGPVISPKELEALFDILMDLLQQNDILIISGSIPKGIETTIYRDIIAYCNDHHIVTVLDTSGELFAESTTASPTIIKPNRYELEQYMKQPLPDSSDVIKAAQSLLLKGINQVIVSLGKDGSIYVDKENVYSVKGMYVEAVSAVGAGDSYVAGYCVGLSQKLDVKDRLVTASAVAMASVKTSGTKPGSLEDVETFKQHLEIITMEEKK